MTGKDQYGQPTWTDADAVNLAVDLTTAADSISSGQYRRGTQAQREAAAAFEGLEWWQTDADPGKFRYQNSEWVRVFAGIELRFHTGATIAGKNWDGVSPLITQHWQTVLRGSAAGNGWTSIETSRFPNGLLHVGVTPIEGAEIANVGISGTYTTTTSKIFIRFWRAGGSTIAKDGLVRASILAIGW